MSTPRAARDLGTSQAAKLARCSMQTVIRWCDEGQLPHYRLPTRTRPRRIKRADLVAFLRANGMGVIVESEP